MKIKQAFLPKGKTFTYFVHYKNNYLKMLSIRKQYYITKNKYLQYQFTYYCMGLLKSKVCFV